MCADTPYNLNWSPPPTVLVLTRTSSLTSHMRMQSGTHAHLPRCVSASATDMQRELHWPTLASRRAVSEAMVVHQSVSGRSPAYLSALFHPSASTHQHATRSASYRGFQVPKVRTEMGKKAFAFRGAQRWNGLPANIRASNSRDISSSIKSHLLTYTT